MKVLYGAQQRYLEQHPELVKNQTNFSPVYAKFMMIGIENSVTMKQAITLARELMVQARKWVDRYESDGDFLQDWLVARNLLPLQARLMVEQVIWSISYRRPGLKKAITGFKPML